MILSSSIVRGLRACRHSSIGGMEPHKDCVWKIFAVRKILASFAGLNNGWKRLSVY